MTLGILSLFLILKGRLVSFTGKNGICHKWGLFGFYLVEIYLLNYNLQNFCHNLLRYFFCIY